MSWDELFNSMVKNGAGEKKRGQNYYIFNPPDDMMGGAAIKYISPTAAEVSRAKSEMKNKIAKKLKTSRVIIVKGNNNRMKSKMKLKSKIKSKLKMKSKVKVKKANSKVNKSKVKRVVKLKVKMKNKIKRKIK